MRGTFNHTEAKKFLDAHFEMSSDGINVSGYGRKAVMKFRELTDSRLAKAIIEGKRDESVSTFMRNGEPVSGGQVMMAIAGSR